MTSQYAPCQSPLYFFCPSGNWAAFISISPRIFFTVRRVVEPCITATSRNGRREFRVSQYQNIRLQNEEDANGGVATLGGILGTGSMASLC